MDLIEQVSGRRITCSYEKKNRVEDDICHISDLRKLQGDHPGWRIIRSLSDIMTGIVRAEEEKLAARVG